MFVCSDNNMNNINLPNIKINDKLHTGIKKYKVTINELKKRCKTMWNILLKELINFLNNTNGRIYLEKFLNTSGIVNCLGYKINLVQAFKLNDNIKIANNLLQQFKDNCNIGINKWIKIEISKQNKELNELEKKLEIAQNNIITLFNLHKINIIKKKINNIKEQFLFKAFNKKSLINFTDYEKLNNLLHIEYIYMKEIIYKQDCLYSQLSNF